MKNAIGIGFFAVLLFAVSTTSLTAQVVVGIPPFQSFGGGPDVINLGNLNVHYSMPVFGRAGRGIPFSYALAYDSSVWQPVGSAWSFSGGGLTRDVPAAVGFISATWTQHSCIDHYDGSRVYYNFYHYISYRDSAGTLHNFPYTVVNDDDGTCLPPSGGPHSATMTIGDGSGMTITVDDGPSASVVLRDGRKISPVVSLTNGSGGAQSDSNGNEITSSTTSGVTSFFDTLSSTTAAMTISGAFPSPVSYKYAAPSGAQAAVVVSVKSYLVQTSFGCSAINEYGPISNSLVDKITLADGSFYQFAYEKTPISGNSNVTGRIASIQLPTGGTISYNYQGYGNNGIICTDGSTAGFTRTTPDGTWTYSRSGTSPAYTTTITDPQSNVTVINFNGNFETQRQIYQGAATGTPLETILTCYNGNTTNCASATVTAPFGEINVYRQFNGGSQARTDTFYDTTYSLIQESDEYDFGVTTPSRKTTTSYGSYNSSTGACTGLGNGIVDHPCLITVTDGSGNLKSKTGYAYDEIGTTGTVGTPNHVGVTGARGNPTTVTTYVTATKTLTKTATYYDTGTTNTTTDVNSAQTTYAYGTASCGNSFPTSVTFVPLSLSKSTTWNCTGGVISSSTDANGQTSYKNYTTDPYFWRPESTKDPLLNVTSFSYPSLIQSEGYLNFNGTVSTVDVTSTLDSLGRPFYSQRKQGQSSGNYDTAQQNYDSLGRPYQATVPYLATTTTNPTPPNNTPITTAYYDALGRPTQVVDGGNEVVNLSYIQNDVYSEVAPAPTAPPAPAAENTKRKQVQYDGLGRLTSVCEVTNEATYSGSCAQTNPLTGYLTNYVYDVAPNYNSLTVTQSVQKGTSQTRIYVYDMLGRLTAETNPETSNLAYTYTYDSDTTCGTSNGDLVKRVDANTNVTCYSYDPLHRVLTVTYPSGPNSSGTLKKYFVYDSATVNSQAMQFAKGRLAEAYTCTTCPATKITDLGLSYSKRGELTDVYQSTTHSSGYYHVTASYWAHGGVDTFGLLNSAGASLIPTQTYGVDGEGRTASVSAGSGQNPVSAVVYTNTGTTEPLGSLTSVTLGSGDTDSFTYDPNTGRMTEYKFSIGTTPSVVKGDLTWNTNGTLAKLAITDAFDSANAQTCGFGYDDLARITSANCGTAWSQTFSLDPFGNTSKSGNSNFQPGWDQTKNWFLPVSGFDSNGNLKSDVAHTYTWDAENKLTAIDSVNLTFDALGRMVEQARGTSYTQIVYSPGGGKLALMSGQTLQKAFVPLPGGGTAVYTSAGLAYYRHPDWLGSSRFASTPTVPTTKYFDVAYAPYGEDYADSGTSDLNFTGQNQDTVSGLYDFLYREYSPSAGRWIQPDPAGLGTANMASPQTWNRYAYVTNNPLSFTDPTGLWGSDAIQYLRAMARTDGFFSRFEFFTVWLMGSNGERRVPLAWIGFAGPGGDSRSDQPEPCVVASALPHEVQTAYYASRALSWLTGQTASVGVSGGGGLGLEAGPGWSLGGSGSATLSFVSDKNSSALVLTFSGQFPTVMSSIPNWGGGAAANAGINVGLSGSPVPTSNGISVSVGASGSIGPVAVDVNPHGGSVTAGVGVGARASGGPTVSATVNIANICR
jgi:RHS repeat-associated protein